MNENLEEQFKNVDIVSYTKELLDSGKITLEEVEKFARIHARQGVVGEEIVTKMKDGLEETRNVVTADENGNPGMVVTNPSGEEYIVPAETFAKKYEIDPENPTVYKPKGGPMLSYKTDENLSFMAPWGEEMKIAAGGHIMVNPENFNDMYGIQGPEFDETYKPVKPKLENNNLYGDNMMTGNEDMSANHVEFVDQNGEVTNLDGLTNEQVNQILNSGVGTVRVSTDGELNGWQSEEQISSGKSR